ncbi:MAG: hypothetical protein LBR47_04870 [Spirochaetaceae bacterium]|nr:hypothetical protein [Spirochaetaceae bacterium]
MGSNPASLRFERRYIPWRLFLYHCIYPMRDSMGTEGCPGRRTFGFANPASLKH